MLKKISPEHQRWIKNQTKLNKNQSDVPCRHQDGGAWQQILTTAERGSELHQVIITW